MTRLRPLLLLTALLGLAACDSNEPHGLPVYGDFAITVTSSAGDSLTFSGNAFASYDGDAFQRVLLSEADEDGYLGARSVTLLPAESAPLRPGTYALTGFADPDPTAGFRALYSDLSTPAVTISPETGEVTITAVSDGAVLGDLSFEGSGRPLTPDGPTRYTVRGSFGALVTRPPEQGL